MSPTLVHRQRGAALVVSLIMLVLVTLLVITALNLGLANFRAVSNSQFRDEAIAAANAAIQSRIAADFDTLPDPDVPEVTDVDLNNDGTDDYQVELRRTCISASIAESADASSVKLPPGMSVASTWNTVWDVAATVRDPDTGVAVDLRAGVRVLLSQAERDTACPEI